MDNGDRHTRLIGQLASLAPGQTFLDQVCHGSVALLGVSGAAVILMSEEESGALTASFGARLAEVQDLQFVLGEGPCLESSGPGRRCSYLTCGMGRRTADRAVVHQATGTVAAQLDTKLADALARCPT